MNGPKTEFCGTPSPKSKALDSYTIYDCLRAKTHSEVIACVI